MVLTPQWLWVPASGGRCDVPPGQASQLRRGVLGAQLRGCESWQHHRRVPEAQRPHSSHQEDQVSPWLSWLSLCRPLPVIPTPESPHPAPRLPPCASVSMQMQPKPQGGNQKASYLLKFTTPFGIPVGVSKAGRSFSPSLMAFIRNTCKGRVKGHCESWQRSPPRLLDPEWEVSEALGSDRPGREPDSMTAWLNSPPRL